MEASAEVVDCPRRRVEIARSAVDVERVPTMTAPKAAAVDFQGLEEAVLRATARIAELVEQNGKLERQLVSARKKSPGAKTDSALVIPGAALRERLESLEQELETLLAQ